MQSPKPLVRFEYVAGRELCWARASFWSREWELRAGSDVAARWHHPRWWSSRARAEVIGASWTLAQSGFFRRGVRATDAHGRVVAAYQPPGFTRGTVELAHGQRLLVESEGWIAPTSSLLTEQRLLIARFIPERRAGLRLQLRIEVAPRVVQSELPLLVVLMGYMLVMRARDRAAAAAAG